MAAPASDQNGLRVALDVSGQLRLEAYAPSVDLVHLPTHDAGYKFIAQKFREGWKHPQKAMPTIKSIFYITYSSIEGLVHTRKFREYRDKVGNAQMHFHGTRRACRIGEGPSSLTCCTSDTCNLCSILRGSYKVARAKAKRMFGPGIYTTLVSSKADGYCANTQTGMRSRVMIVNHVALGLSKVMLQANQGMQQAPPSYNSVTAATHPEGGKVIYHEAVVYHEDAIIANAIVVYE